MGDFLFGPKPQAAQVDQAATTQQAGQAFGNTQQGLNQQAAFLQALQAQGGLQNQSSVFNQLQGVANGTGPNPAAAMLNNATGANTANQAALMAGQRGAGANAGLIARQAAMTGATNQQNAAGQAANLQATQSLNAMGQMGNIADQQVANQGNAANAFTQAAIGQQGNVYNAIGNANNARVTGQNNVNDQNAKRGFMGVVSGLGQAATGIGNMFAHGGAVPKSNVGKHLSSKKTAPAGTDVGSAMKDGGTVPGQAKVKGDSLKNDTVDAKLSPGEIVIPRSVAQGKDAPKKAAEFVAAVLKRKGK